MNDFDVVTGPAPGIRPDTRHPARDPQKPTPPSAPRSRDDGQVAPARLTMEGESRRTT